MDWGECAKTIFNNTTYTVASLSCLPKLFTNVLNALFMFAGVVALFIIIISGIRFILSAGDAKQLEGAQNTLKYAIFGLILIFLSSFILNIIAYVTGVNCILTIGPFEAASCK